jgi:hypothetical protein
MSTPGTLDPRITFTRGSTATYFNNTGTMQTAATNVPRWDYNPSTLALMGMLIEEGRTNICLQSGALATWSTYNNVVVAPVVTAAQTIAPDGTLTGTRLDYPAVSGTNAASVLQQVLTFSAASYSFSVYLRGSAGGEHVYLGLNVNGFISSSRITLTTQWQRFVVTATAVAGAAGLSIGTDLRDSNQAATSAQTIYAWGGQVEQGAFATSYIPTTAAAVTRAVEVMSLTDAALFLGANGKTIQVEGLAVQNMPAGQDGYWVDLHDSGSTNVLQLITPPSSSGIRTVVYQSPTTYVNGADVALTRPTVFKAALANSTVWNSAINGSLAPGSGGASAIGTGAYTVLHMGSGSTAVGGYIRRVRFWQRALSSFELQSVTG